MSAQSLLTALALPPVALVLLALAGSALAGSALARRRRFGALVATAASLGALALATPLVSGLLLASLAVPRADPTAHPTGDPAPRPGAIIVLGGDAANGREGAEVGPLTLERLRAGAALHRRTGLPLLVTAGPNAPGEPPLGDLMARSLAADFGTPARWTEDRARDTRDNARLSAAMLARDGIGAAHLVTHAWHMPRAVAAFARAGFRVVPAPLRTERVPDGRAEDWVPRADHWAGSWFALREWVGRLVYEIRD